MEPRPVPHTGEDEGSCPGGDEPGEERAADRPSGDRTALRGQLEQHQRRHNGPAEQRGDGRESTREREQAPLLLLQPHEVHHERRKPKPDGDQRRLGAEHEPQAQRRGCGEHDADEVDRAYRAHVEPQERVVPPMARQPDRGSDDEPCECRHEDDVPGGGLAPVEPVRDVIPDEMGQIVDRRLKQHCGGRDRNAEQAGQDECPQVGAAAQPGLGWGRSLHGSV